MKRILLVLPSLLTACAPTSSSEYIGGGGLQLEVFGLLQGRSEVAGATATELEEATAQNYAWVSHAEESAIPYTVHALFDASDLVAQLPCVEETIASVQVTLIDRHSTLMSGPQRPRIELDLLNAEGDSVWFIMAPLNDVDPFSSNNAVIGSVDTFGCDGSPGYLDVQLSWQLDPATSTLYP